jgi:hypothetical protein
MPRKVRSKKQETRGKKQEARVESGSKSQEARVGKVSRARKQELCARAQWHRFALITRLKKLSMFYHAQNLKKRYEALGRRSKKNRKEQSKFEQIK